MINWLAVDKIVTDALIEDIAYGDISSEYIFDKNHISSCRIIAKESGILAGIDVVKMVLKKVDEKTKVSMQKNDGENLTKGDVIATIEGSTISLLKAERVALNFLQRLSGIATLTSKYVELVKEFDTVISDTRKTTPGLRMLEKYAVTMGGGHNHRRCLSDSAMLKDNHIMASKGIKNAVNTLRKKVSHTIKIEVETESLEQVQEALDSGVDIIMLDNMSAETMTEAVKMINKRVIVEASGNVSLDNVKDVAKTGVDVISIGALTHSVKSLDISMRFF